MQATDQSLVIVDELGRGTSTFDGAAIASAVLRHFAHKARPPASLALVPCAFGWLVAFVGEA